ncbi:MAG: phosphoglucosamine mutase [Deltaproteobacteria bacterium]|nr:phosphoglucosamine mutase [Deltaproteobacteria bacterium]
MNVRKLFGTDGIRGRANEHPMTVDVALKLGRALAERVKSGALGRAQQGGRGEHRGRIVIGKDTRLSGYMIEQAIAAGVTSRGVDVMLVGPLPTPGIAFITRSMRADAGIVVSASHNPYEDNGIKIFGHDGYKLPDAEELAIERLMAADALGSGGVFGESVGRATRIDDARGRYIVDLKSTFPNDLTLEGRRVVIDCAHGAAYRTAPEVFRELGAEVIALAVSPNGTNINEGVGALHPQGVQQAVLAHHADLGIALDGDADRVIVVDERGSVIDGDAVMAVCARELARRGALRGATLVSTVMSNIGLERSLKSAGVRVERVQVGDRYVVERMREGGFNLGGEQSGHLIFLDHTTTGDGVVAALNLVSVMVREQRALSEIAAVFQASPQELVNIKVGRKVPLEELPSVQAVIDEVTGLLGGDGRVLVRYSGTEMKARVMVEGPDAATVGALARRIADALANALA